MLFNSCEKKDNLIQYFSYRFKYLHYNYFLDKYFYRIMDGIKKTLTGLIILGIGLSSILTPIIFTLNNPEQEINEDNYILIDNLNDEEPQPIKDDGGTGKDDDPEPKDQIITATVDFCPKTLNLKSKGKWVTIYIELPVEYNVANINLTTVILQEIIPAELNPSSLGDYDEDNIPDLMVKFNRQDLKGLLEPGENVEITVTGEFSNGNGLTFEGMDTNSVINP